jgi:hypothetical protein
VQGAEIGPQDLGRIERGVEALCQNVVAAAQLTEASVDPNQPILRVHQADPDRQIFQDPRIPVRAAALPFGMDGGFGGQDRHETALPESAGRLLGIRNLHHVKNVGEETQWFRAGFREAADEDDFGFCGQAEAPA